MTSSHNWPSSPPLRTKTPFKLWLTSRYPFATCHIVCQPPSLPLPKRRPPPVWPIHLLSPQATPPPGNGRKRPKHPPHQPPPWLTILNTSYDSTTLSLARRSATPRSMLGCTHAATRPENTGEAHMT